ncbi:prephenate dehydrogenase [Virgibacillus sp. W0430]|uniref:prephenate dehydrogenase n=1 Tax=Virgibacillus sp. W0430 TaxID=3391580 RepID=UPI003F461728
MEARKIVVAGLGLIGGSLAKAIKQSNENYIIGYDLSQETLDYAKAHHMIDTSYSNFSEAVKEADIVFLAAPISQTIQLLKKLDAISFRKEVIVSDVSSVKGTILDAANKLTNDKITFIGGHPMAGSHKAGVRAAKEHLFENAIYVLTPTTNCANDKINILKNVLKDTKSHFITLQPDEHDEMTSVVSHFPHLIASSLVHQARKWETRHAFLPELAAGGFRDITRIASSNPTLWQDIFLHNGNKMSVLLEEWIKEMETLKHIVDGNKKEDMISYLQQAKAFRDGLKPSARGALPAYYDVYVDIKDQPGALAKVVQLLADNDISIKNIRILEIRDDVNGALRLSVSTKEEQLMSCQLLQQKGYEISIEN